MFQSLLLVSSSLFEISSTWKWNNGKEMKNVQCLFGRFRLVSLMVENQCGKERKEARRILHSRARCFDTFFKCRCTFYKVLNYQLSITWGSSFVQRTQILSIFSGVSFYLFCLLFLSSGTVAFLNKFYGNIRFYVFFARSAYSGIGSVCCWLYWKKGLSSNKTLFDRLKRKLLRLLSH